MAWTLTLDTVTATEGDWTAGEAEVAFAYVQMFTLHTWEQVTPTHCPSCLCGHLIAMLTARARVSQGDAAATVTCTPLVALLDTVTIDEER